MNYVLHNNQYGIITMSDISLWIEISKKFSKALPECANYFKSKWLAHAHLLKIFLISHVKSLLIGSKRTLHNRRLDFYKTLYREN